MGRKEDDLTSTVLRNMAIVYPISLLLSFVYSFVSLAFTGRSATDAFRPPFEVNAYGFSSSTLPAFLIDLLSVATLSFLVCFVTRSVKNAWDYIFSYELLRFIAACIISGPPTLLFLLVHWAMVALLIFASEMAILYLIDLKDIVLES
jgi:hypothetical protein